jgi:hypothetical protein
MKEKKEKKLPCHVCKKMIPKAAALHPEGQDYVLHFCSLECLDYWQNRKNRKEV